MTSIRKYVRRITVTETIRERGKDRRIIARLGPGDSIVFRLHGTRLITDELSIKELYWIALKRTVKRTWETENKKRKELGRRLLGRPTLLR
jgi:hypothetical protein